MVRFFYVLGLTICSFLVTFSTKANDLNDSVQQSDAKDAVFKVYVTNTERSNVPDEGTAFVIHSSGDSSNPTLYFLTAAHVILGPDADDANLDLVEKVEVRFGSAKGDVWEIEKGTIRFPQQWESSGRDFALFKVVKAGRTVKPLIVNTNPVYKHMGFTAIGYLQQSKVQKISVEGKIITGPEEAENEPWLLVEAPLSPGMSGGPALSPEGVFAIVQGHHKSTQELKFLVPLRLAQEFIRNYIPDFQELQSKPGSTFKEPPTEINALRKWIQDQLDRLGYVDPGTKGIIDPTEIKVCWDIVMGSKEDDATKLYKCAKKFWELKNVPKTYAHAGASLKYDINPANIARIRELLEEVRSYELSKKD